MPGTSRHHWGTDIDLHETTLKGPAFNNSTFQNGRGKEFYSWLQKNAAKFGFCQPYTGTPEARNGGMYKHGYQEERWHWSYRPLSAEYLYQYVTQKEKLIPSGYAGEKVAAKFYLDFVENVDPSCK